MLRNTGILFESDNLTGYPTLDATGATTRTAPPIGIDLLSPEFTHQLILEAAVLQVFGDPATATPRRPIRRRHALPGAHLERHAAAVRRDARLVRQHARRLAGVRAEYRWKF